MFLKSVVEAEAAGYTTDGTEKSSGRTRLKGFER